MLENINAPKELLEIVLNNFAKEVLTAGGEDIFYSKVVVEFKPSDIEYLFNKGVIVTEHPDRYMLSEVGVGG